MKVIPKKHVVRNTFDINIFINTLDTRRRRTLSNIWIGKSNNLKCPFKCICIYLRILMSNTIFLSNNVFGV
jgi:hypothetical protein